jgi:hypothetical protein
LKPLDSIRERTGLYLLLIRKIGASNERQAGKRDYSAHVLGDIACLDLFVFALVHSLGCAVVSDLFFQIGAAQCIIARLSHRDWYNFARRATAQA